MTSIRRRDFIMLLGGATAVRSFSPRGASAASGTTLSQVSPTAQGSAPGLHRNLRIKATVGKEARVYGHLRLSRGCVEGPLPEMTITKPPSIGTLTVRTETVTLTAPNFGTCGPGHSGDGAVVYYKASTAGKDAFEYQMSSPGLPTTTWTATVVVR